jgi:hypothetical protein
MSAGIGSDPVSLGLRTDVAQLASTCARSVVGLFRHLDDAQIRRQCLGLLRERLAGDRQLDAYATESLVAVYQRALDVALAARAGRPPRAASAS